MIHFLTIGIILGLSAGFSPGPLMTLVLTETLQHGIKSGVKVALSPIISDLPIIVLTYFILAKLSGFHNIIGFISLIGGALIAYIGYESIRAKEVQIRIPLSRSKSLTRGIMVNLFNPNPYLFWLSIGAPTLTKAMGANFVSAFLFIFGFYGTLTGSKILLSITTGKSRPFINGKIYKYILRFLGLALWALAIILFHDGLKLMGIL